MYKIEPLAKSHDREEFDCDSEPLNAFLRQTARQHGERSICQTFVLVDEQAAAPKPILGIFSLNIYQVNAELLPPGEAKKLPRNVSGVQLGRVAVAKDHQRQGLGKKLLVGAMEKFMDIFARAGGIGLLSMRRIGRPNVTISSLDSLLYQATNLSFSCRPRRFKRLYASCRGVALFVRL